MHGWGSRSSWPSYPDCLWAPLSSQQRAAAAAEGAALAAGGRRSEPAGARATPEAQAAVQKLQALITDRCYTCTYEILAGLGEMYVADERFTKNIDLASEGTAAFASEAIRAYCDK